MNADISGVRSLRSPTERARATTKHKPEHVLRHLLPCCRLVRHEGGSAYLMRSKGSLITSAWIPAKEIAPLSPHDIDAFLREPHRKSTGSLREAYEIAKEPSSWDAEQQRKRQAMEDKWKAQNQEVDELEEEEDDGAQAGAKRKKVGEKKETKKRAKLEKVSFI